MLMEELNAQDVFGDIIRQLRQRAEQLSDTYDQFGQDLKPAVEDLAKMEEEIIDLLLQMQSVMSSFQQIMLQRNV